MSKPDIASKKHWSPSKEDHVHYPLESFICQDLRHTLPFRTHPSSPYFFLFSRKPTFFLPPVITIHPIFSCNPSALLPHRHSCLHAAQPPGQIVEAINLQQYVTLRFIADLCRRPKSITLPFPAPSKASPLHPLQSVLSTHILSPSRPINHYITTISILHIQIE